MKEQVALATLYQLKGNMGISGRHLQSEWHSFPPAISTSNPVSLSRTRMEKVALLAIFSISCFSELSKWLKINLQLKISKEYS